MTRRVIFLISGPGHIPNLVVAVRSLRKYYSGIVQVMTWPESQKIVSRVCEDKSLDVSMIPWEAPFKGSNSTYCDKTRLIQQFPIGDNVVFLDADVLVQGSIEPIFSAVEKYGFTMAQFNDWVTTGATISGRIRTLLDFPEIEKSLIAELLCSSWKSVNSGIFGAKPESPVLPLWKEWTFAARTTFIPDEKVAHVVMAKFHPTEFRVLDGGAYNCSPKYQPESLSDDDVVIWHFHGDSNLRPEKSQKGYSLWRNEYIKAIAENVGGMAEWINEIPNKHLVALRNKNLL